MTVSFRSFSKLGWSSAAKTPSTNSKSLENSFSLLVLQERLEGFAKEFAEEGVVVNSHSHSGGLSLDGLPSGEAKEVVIKHLEAAGQGSRKVNYKLRDWLFARQRYWGEPFPIVFREGSKVPACHLDLACPYFNES